MFLSLVSLFHSPASLKGSVCIQWSLMALDELRHWGVIEVRRAYKCVIRFSRKKKNCAQYYLSATKIFFISFDGWLGLIVNFILPISGICLISISSYVSRQHGTCTSLSPSRICQQTVPCTSSCVTNSETEVRIYNFFISYQAYHMYLCLIDSTSKLPLFPNTELPEILPAPGMQTRPPHEQVYKLPAMVTT